jgi:hypothetical protein
MTKRKSALMAAILAIAHIPSAHAYLDPGTGSMIIQGLIAAVGAGLVAGRMYWTKLKGFFGRKTTSLDSSDESVDEKPTTRKSDEGSGV